MEDYTVSIENRMYDAIDSDDFGKELIDVVEQFRSFDKALDSFLSEYGMNEDDSVQDKVKFITDIFKSSGIPVPRNIGSWYLDNKKISKSTAISLCFALNLSVEKTEDFLRRVCLCRGFDCHSIDEVVYYFCLKNNLSFSDAQRIISMIPNIRQSNIDSDNVIYTRLILAEIDRCSSEDELVKYLTNNSNLFAYNNATAYGIIHNLWTIISGDEGIALREKERIYDEFSDECNEVQANGRKLRKREDDSIWEIYLQIIGLSGTASAEFYKDRSIKPILNDNKLIHYMAADSFPNRDGITKILNDVHVSDESVRKVIILFAFYRFWAQRALKNNSYAAQYGDADRCIAEINSLLLDAHYPELYEGNPYDFMFFYACNNDSPLKNYREYVREIYYYKKAKDEYLYDA